MTHRDAIALIKAFEGFSKVPYVCPAGVWTIGYGSTYGMDRSRVTAKSWPIAEPIAEYLLERDVRRFDRAVQRLVTVDISARQHGALVSFSYNLGSGALKSSTLLKRVNSDEWDDVPYQFSRWVHAGGRRLAGLVRRRKAEANLWKAG